MLAESVRNSSLKDRGAVNQREAAAYARKALSVLGLAEGASIDEVKAAYRGLARAWHPDRFPRGSEDAEFAAERLRSLNQAHAWLIRNADDWPKAIKVVGRTETSPNSQPSTRVSEKGKSETTPHLSEVFDQTKVGKVGMGPVLLRALILTVFVTGGLGVYGVVSGANTVPVPKPADSSDAATRSAPIAPAAPAAQTAPQTAPPGVAAEAQPPLPQAATSQTSSATNQTAPVALAAASLDQLKAAHEARDARLNDVYQAVRAIAPEDLFIQLRDTQRSWIRYRDDNVADSALFMRGSRAGGLAPDAWPEYWQWMTDFTNARVRYLEGWLQALNGEHAGMNPWEGQWTDSYGGYLNIERATLNELTFSLEVVRGATGRTGQIDGTASIGASTARFEAGSLAGQRGLTLSLQGPTLVVDEFGDVSSYYGAGAGFAGVYSRTR